jgi:hypothetical protein
MRWRSPFPKEYVRGFLAGRRAGELNPSIHLLIEWDRFDPAYCHGYMAGCLAALAGSAYGELLSLPDLQRCRSSTSSQ